MYFFHFYFGIMESSIKFILEQTNIKSYTDSTNLSINI